jgi:hypothetical protein
MEVTMGMPRRVLLLHIVFPFTLGIAGIPLAAAQPSSASHENRFEMTEPFIRNQWRHPVRSLDVVPQGAGPVHIPADDCEIHVGAELVDQSISNFVGLVLEPPNVCKDKTKSKTAWRAFYEGATGKTCTAAGFIRAWPEHLDSGSGNSNPPHFMELHPLRELSCSPGPKIVLRDKLRAFPDMGYKDAALVDVIFRTFQLWVKRMPHPDTSAPTTIAFDYRVCNREETACGNRVSVPNFARLTVRPLSGTLRSVPAGASEEAFKTLIARARSHSDDESEVVHAALTKLYALDGTDFFQALGNGSVIDKNFDVLGIFTIDSLSVIKTLDAMKDKGTDDWTEVSFPIAMIVFGQMADEP